MNIVEWTPMRELDSIFERSPFRYFNGLTSPRVDVYQTDRDIIVKAEIPGVTKEDINLYIDDNSIRLSGQAKKNTEFNDENVYKTERYYGGFSRTIPLPVEIKSEEASAAYKDGILSITVPKVEQSKTRGKKIEIQ